MIKKYSIQGGISMEMKYKTNEVKKDFIKYRVTKEEKEIISNRAKEYNMNMSNYIRYLIDKDLKNK